MVTGVADNAKAQQQPGYYLSVQPIIRIDLLLYNYDTAVGLELYHKINTSYSISVTYN